MLARSPPWTSAAGVVILPAMITPGEVLDFWFDRAGGATALRFRDEWFRKTEAFDAAVRARLGDASAAAVAGGFAAWEDAPDTRLALLLLLDQVPRNLCRGEAAAFAGDARALALAKAGIAKGFDRNVGPVERVFYYMPLEHAENPQDQELSVRLLTALNGEIPDRQLTYFAERHREIILRFGRFPHRNAALGRTSTAEELAFLQEPHSSF